MTTLSDEGIQPHSYIVQCAMLPDAAALGIAEAYVPLFCRSVYSVFTWTSWKPSYAMISSLAGPQLQPSFVLV